MTRFFAGLRNLRHLRIASVLALLLLGLACDHSGLGFDQLERGVADPQWLAPARPVAVGCYGKYNVNGPPDYLVLGRNHAYQSRVLIRFASDSIDLDSLSSARLVLYTLAHHRVRFAAYPVTTDWDDYQTTWHDAKTGEPWLDEGGDFDTLLQVADTTVEPDSLIIPLDSARLGIIADHEYGLMLVPRANDSGTFATLYSRSTTGKKPKLVLQYGTTKLTREATQNTYIVDTLGLNLKVGQLWLGSGYVFRSYLKFNLDSLRADTLSPPLTVMAGELAIHPESAFALQETMYLGVHRLTKPYERREENAPFDNALSARKQYVRGDTTVSFDLRSLVQFWADRPDSNFGLLLTVEPANFKIARVELKRSALLPTLRVGFARPPHGKFQQ